MSTLAIGRISLADPISNISKWSMAGDAVEIEGKLHTTPENIALGNIDEVLVKRHQLAGYVGNGDEEVVPVIFSEDPSVTGFYRVMDVLIESMVGSAVHGVFDYRIALQRVHGFAAPLMESVLVGALRTNPHSITYNGGGGAEIAVAAHAVPDAVGDYAPIGINGLAPASQYTRVGSDGTIEFHDTIPSGAFVWQSQYSLAAASAYVGAVVIRADSPLYTIVGQQAPATPASWELSNGLVKITPTAAGKLDVAHYNGASWEPAKRFILDNGAGTQLFATGFKTLTILRNSPEECSIRLTGERASDGPTCVDLTLKRGARTVTGYASFLSGSTPGWGVNRDVAEASTNLVGGIRATANDADGNRFVLSTSVAYLTDATNLANGRLRQSVAAPTFTFMISSEVGGSGAAADDLAQQLIDVWFFPISERITVVGR